MEFDITWGFQAATLIILAINVSLCRVAHKEINEGKRRFMPMLLKSLNLL